MNSRLDAIADVSPGKIIAVHINYPSRSAERGRTPELPSYFLKPTTSLSFDGVAVERPAGCELLAFEGEIALIMGEKTRHIAPQEAWNAVAGVTASNDFGVYDLRYADKGSNLRSKGADGFTPVGPRVLAAHDVDPAGLRVRTWLNGELVQSDTTDTLLFPFAQLIADLSQLITLEPGDIILTGTPAGASVAKPGDIVEVEVDAPGHPEHLSTGRLRNTISQGTYGFGDFGARPIMSDVERADAWGTRRTPASDTSIPETSTMPEGVTAVSTSPGPPAPKPPLTVLTDRLRAKINSVGTATLSSQLRKRGLNNVHIDGLMPTRPSQRLVGLARTLRFVPNREDLFASHGGGYNAQKRAFDSLGSGDVLVVDARGETGTGTVGDILALRAQVRGAAGIVTDGGIRDIGAVTALEIPTYHAGAHPAVLGRRHVPWDSDLTIACGGATVQPGDVIVGDADGLLVIPPALIEELVDAAIEQERQETFIAEQVANGKSVDGLYPMNVECMARYQTWLSR